MGNTKLKVTLDTVFAVWFGGPNYLGASTADVETFPNLETAAEAMLDRASIGYFRRQDFNYLNKPSESVLTPSVDCTECSMDLYSADPEQGGSRYGRLLVGDDGEVFIDRD